jgi:hypothetical protein
MSTRRWRSGAAFSAALATAVTAGIVSTASAGPRTIRAYESGVTSLGRFHPLRHPVLAGALHAFGSTSSRRDLGFGCLAKWRRLGLVLQLTNYGLYHGSICAPRNGIAQGAIIRGRRGRVWRTRRGLHVGSSTIALYRRYPRAQRHGGWVWLVVGRTPIGCERPRGCPYPVLRARTSHHHVRAFKVFIGGAGD